MPFHPLAPTSAHTSVHASAHAGARRPLRTSARRGLRALALLSLPLVWGCSDGSTEPPPAPVSDIRFGEALPDRGLAGEELEAPVQVRVLRDGGEPAAGVEVRWEVTSGGGSVASATSTSGDDGRAQTRWTLGPEPGIQRLRIQAGSAVLATHLQAVPDAPARLRLGELGDGQVGEGRPFVFELEHELGDRTSASGVAVVEVLDRSGTSGVGGPSTTISVDTVSWSAGVGELEVGETLVRPGLHRVRVRIPGTGLDEHLDFELSPGPAHQLLPERPWEGVTFEAGRTLPEPPGVRVRDRFENPLPGRAVEVVVDSDGSVEAPEPVTDDQGRASPGRWTLGPDPGLQTLTFRLEELELALEVEATEARLPTEFLAEAAAQRTVTPGQLVPALSVRVLDQHGDPLPWVRVLWSVDDEDGELRADPAASFGSEAETLTDSQGRSTLSAWRPGQETGTRQLRVRIPGTDLSLVYSAVVADSPSTDGFEVEGAYLVQTVQTPLQDVVLVEGRPAVVRAFVHGAPTGGDADPPPVELELLRGGSVVRSWVVAPPSGGVPAAQGEAEGDWSRSYNRFVDAADIRSGTRLRARLVGGQDPGPWWPSSDGLPLSTVDLDPLPVRLVPVTVDSLDRTGAVDPGSADSYLSLARPLLPHPDLVPSVGTPFTWSDPPLAPDGEQWVELLAALRERRAQSGGSGIWYGVVPLDYSQGVVGVGYIGLPVSLGWDREDLRAWILAHELGHNLGRLHAPCGVFPFDVQYPHPEGHIDAWGLDPNTLVPVPPDRCDIMGYAGPANSWVSPYTFNGMAFFAAQQSAMAAPPAGPVLRVWGSATPSGPRIRPAYVTDIREALPGDLAQGDPVRIELLDARGHSLLEVESPTLPISHSEVRGIGVDIPLADFDPDALAGIRITDGAGRSVERWSGGEGAPGAAAAPVDPSPRLDALPGGGWRLVWASGPAPLALVHLGATGEFLALGEGGSLVLPDDPRISRGLQVRFSDGIRTSAPVELHPGG